MHYVVCLANKIGDGMGFAVDLYMDASQEALQNGLSQGLIVVILTFTAAIRVFHARYSPAFSWNAGATL